MAAIISDKFRIFNAKQFLESLTEGATDTSAERTRMYFFVGRPQPWAAYLEFYSRTGGSFSVGDEVYVGASYVAATFRATVSAVYSDALLLTSVFGANGVNSTPGALGATLVGWTGGTGGSATGATAKAGVYRYGTENEPPLPLDNQTEKFDVYDDIIAAKRITSEYARAVVRRYNWDLVANPKFDMWKPDYSATPAGGGQIGKTSATGQTSIADAKFYVMNSAYEVFKCLYNGENPANPSGQNATQEPITTSGNYTNGIFTESQGAGYVWKYMYTLPTDDVIRFLSSDFLPVVLPTNASRIATQTAAVPGAINVVLVEDAGSNLPAAQTLYTAIRGDGTGGVVEIQTTAGGAISSARVATVGSGYTYASVSLANGSLFGNQALTSNVATPAGATGAIEVVLPPQGGHGSDMELELNAKRVMTNIRLTYAEGAGDFPVDNDFRRIGIIKDPINAGSSQFATADTLNGLYAVKIANTGGTDYIVDELISQTVNGGANTAYGTVVSWVLDQGSTTSGILKFYQRPAQHIDSNGVLYPFEANGAASISGALSAAGGNPDTTVNGSVEGITLTNGLGEPEIDNNSGDVIYIENRRLITRAPDQIEDIKLVIEF
jgi:hypothetical protein